MPRSLLFLICVCLVAGCGGSEKTDEQQLQEVLVAYTRDLTSGDFANACRRTANPAGCIEGLRGAELAVGGREELLVMWDFDPDELVDGARNAKVTVRGDRATLDNPATPESGVPAVRRDGQWKIVFPTD